MTAKTMLFGPLGRMLPIPYPEAEMGWDFNRDVEETALLDGGRHVYEAPTPFKRYKLQYKGGTADLQNLVDIYTGVYGKGPYYLVDFNYSAGNILPTRWASAYMLRHVAGAWANPAGVPSASALSGEAVTFSNLGQFPDTGIPQIIATVPGAPAYLRLWGTRTGTASVRISLLDASTNVWTSPVNHVPSASPSPVAVISAGDGTANTYSAIKLELYVPSGSTLTLDHINLTGSTGDSTRLPGRGVGAVSFTENLTGNIQTKRFDRIGLSLGLVEVE
jgi:hypothetical protein